MRGRGGVPPVRLNEGKGRVTTGPTKGREGAGRRQPGARQGVGVAGLARSSPAWQDAGEGGLLVR
jgi:hypothetical protein